jgi:hypothetical protein
MTDTEVQTVFAPPAPELVQHAVRELGWDDRFQVAKMSGTHGNALVDVYNFPDLVNSIFGTRWNELLLDGSKASLVWVDADELVMWLRNVIGDGEFADAVEVAVAKEEGYRDQIDAIVPLFRERVAQYHAVLDEVEQSEE